MDYKNTKKYNKSKSYIFVIDTFEQHQLPVGPLGMGLVLERPAELLHCHRNTQVCV